MGSYKVQFRTSVSKDLNRIPKQDVRRIVAAVASLADNPRPTQARKLTGSEKYRLRCGIYRVLYEIYEDILVVCVVKIRHRKDAYRS